MRGSNLGVLAVCVATAVACSRSQPPRSSGSARADSAASTTGTPAVTPLPQPAPNAQRPDSAAAKASPRGKDSTAPSPTPRAPRVLPSETVLTGKVVAGGLAASPVTSLQIEGGKPTSLVGPLEPELRRLGGAIVWVSGAPGGGKRNASFTVSRYEIVSIDGVKPLVGRVATRDGALVLARERDTLTLVSAPAVLANKTGAKVWIVGRRSGNDLTLQTYGVIREP